MEENNTQISQETTILYQIRMSKSLQLFRQDLLDKLSENKFQIQFIDQDPSIIEIPSLLQNGKEVVGIFWINHNSLKQLSLEEIFSKIEQFMDHYPVHLLLLENYQKCEAVCDPSLICGFWAFLALNWDCGCIPLRGEEDLILCLTSLAKREQVRDKPPSLARIKEKVDSIDDARVFFLEGLINCGEKKAYQLLRAFKNPLMIVEDLVENHGREILKLEGFGPRFVEDNCTLLTKNMAKTDMAVLNQWMKGAQSE